MIVLSMSDFSPKNDLLRWIMQDVSIIRKAKAGRFFKKKYCLFSTNISLFSTFIV